MGAAENGHTGDKASDLLLKCVDSGRVDVLCSLLSQLKNQSNFHEEIDSPCCTEGTLLHRAVAVDSVDVVNALLANGSNPCVQNDDGKTPFQTCKSDGVRTAFIQEVLRVITMSNTGRLCQLISSGIPVDSVDSPQSKNSLLNWASDFSNVDIVRTLCESGASIDMENAKGETPLLTAVKRGEEAIVRQLLSSGADPSKKTLKGEDATSVATAAGGALLPLLSMEKVTRDVRRTQSEDSVEDRASLISCDTAVSQLFNHKMEKYADGRPESWTDLLWPQPRLIRLQQSQKGFPLPKDNRFKIYFDDSSDGCPRRMMQAIQISTPLLSGVGIDLEYRGHRTSDHLVSTLDGKITVGIFDDGRPSGSYALNIEPRGVEVIASDYAGVRYAFATLTQIIRIHKYAQRLSENESNLLNGGDKPTTGDSNNFSSKLDLLPGVAIDGSLPCMTVRDHPDRIFRAVYQDFSGCRVLNTETLLQLATRLSYCKANYLFLNFEVRTTDRYQLPYTNRDLFHMMQVCEELFITMVPSLDTQSNYLEASACRNIIDQFLDDFPLSKTVHFGPNIASILVHEPKVLASVQRRVPRIFLSVTVDEKNAALLSDVPPYVTLCVEGCFPFETERLLSPRVSLVLKFSTENQVALLENQVFLVKVAPGDDGYLCAAPDSTAKKALLAAKLGERCTIVGSMVCELSTGCETMPPSLSFPSLMASVGTAWNASTDMKKFAFLIPSISAHHILLDGDMSILFEQAATLGRVEHQLTRFAYGMFKPLSPRLEDAEFSGFGVNRRMPISVFVEMLLNPENMNLERLTPVIFKKARIELRRSLQALDAARRILPYNFELALVLAEIKLVSELMVLISRLGQALCMHGMGHPERQRAGEDSRPFSPGRDGLAYSPGRVGVVHLPQTVRTDLANSLLEIRSQFQHVWLSRSIPSTLPNALKMFDNLFKVLLPADLQEMGKQLL